MAGEKHELHKLSRDDLNAAAAAAGIENAEQLPNKDAVVEAIIAAGEQTMYGPYELVGESVNSLTFGADPVITLNPGERFYTSELGVAQFLDAHPAVTAGSQ